MVKGILERVFYPPNNPHLAAYCLKIQTIPGSPLTPMVSTFADLLEGLYPLFYIYTDFPPKLFGIAKTLEEADRINYEQLKSNFKDLYDSFEDKSKKSKKSKEGLASKEDKKEESSVDPYLEGIMKRVSEIE